MSALALELSLHPDDLPRLLKLPELAASGRRVRPETVRTIWHDTPEGDLAEAGLSLAQRSIGRETLWRVERMRPVEGVFWAPGTPAPLVREGTHPAGLIDPMPAPMMPVAGFEGQSRDITTREGVMVGVLSGELRGVAASRRTCRVNFAGLGSQVASLVLALATAVRLSVPPVTLAAEATATARPAPPARRLGAPSLPPGIAVGEAFAFVVAHLLDVILHHAPRALAAERPEPVHQMRVALRRLRSAFGLFGRVADCPALDAAKNDLRAFGAVLGPARDWDVFIGGTCASVMAAFPDDPAVLRLGAQARRRQSAGYAALAAYLEGDRFRHLGITLALLAETRPWAERPVASIPADPTEPADDAAVETAPVEDGNAENGPPVGLEAYAARALHKRLRRLLAPGEDISALPAEALHAIRLDGKRLRYAAEFFAPLFPGRQTRRFLRRMTALQERLGHLNDATVTAELMAQIGHARSHTGGIVRGFVAAGNADARGKIERSWKRFRKQEPFWEQ